MLKRFLCLLVLATGTAHAGSVQLELDIPSLNVAEYHRPYTAIWLEDDSGQARAHLQLWYDGETRWLNELRRWWRRIGRSATLPADGITGATRGPGGYTLTFDDSHPELKALAAGDYSLVIEVSREVGGRETVRLPFTWPVTSAGEQSASGTSELGAVRLVRTP